MHAAGKTLLYTHGRPKMGTQDERVPELTQPQHKAMSLCNRMSLFKDARCCIYILRSCVGIKHLFPAILLRPIGFTLNSNFEKERRTG